MKNIFYTAAITAIASLFLASCSRDTSLSVSKRHYRDGYYVSWNSQDKSTRPDQQVARKEQKQENKIRNNPSENSTAAVEKITAAGNSEKNKPDISPVRNIKQEEKKKSTVDDGEYHPRYKTAEKLLEKAPAFTEHFFSESKTRSNNNNSLIWIIIIILLLLWLLGYIGGWLVGDLLWILLVVLIIILLLKLLGVI